MNSLADVPDWGGAEIFAAGKYSGAVNLLSTAGQSFGIVSRKIRPHVRRGQATRKQVIDYGERKTRRTG
jgi:hypothetical protein